MIKNGTIETTADEVFELFSRTYKLGVTASMEKTIEVIDSLINSFNGEEENKETMVVLIALKHTLILNNMTLISVADEATANLLNLSDEDIENFEEFPDTNEEETIDIFYNNENEEKILKS